MTASNMQRLLCDGCGQATYIDALSPFGFEALCPDCAGDRQSNTVYEREARTAQPPVYVLTENLAYRPTKAELEAEPSDEDRVMVAQLPVEPLRWWFGQPSCYGKLSALVAERLRDLGVEPSRQVPREPTATTRAVTAYWRGRKDQR